jgi:hypothetical protein
VYNGLAEIAGSAGRQAEARQWGRKSLQLNKDAAVANRQRHLAPRLQAAHGARRIIAYSLYGDLPKYCEGALLNARASARVYPGFSCRFYVDDSVPETVLGALGRLGAEVVQVSGDAAGWHPTLWRCMAMADPEVDVVLLRDCDSPLGGREQGLVENWLGTDKAAHVIRDCYAHTPVILAGLFAVKGVRFVGLEASISAYVGRAGLGWGVDQDYLKDVIWPLIAHSVLEHDSAFGDALSGAPPGIRDHAGVGFEILTLTSDQDLSGTDGLHWSIGDNATGTRRYPAVEDEGKAAIRLPGPTVEAFQAGRLAVALRKA